jgi:NADPH-dependent F420 reductase
MAKHRVIAILGGTGHEGGGLALRWAKAGHAVIIGSRDVAKAQATAERLKTRWPAGNLFSANYRDAAAAADIIVLTVPYAAQQSIVADVRDQLAGKILIDTTVPLVPPKVSRVQLPPNGSAVAAIQKLLGESVRVVSAFQNVSAQHLYDLSHDVDCDVLICGNDAAAREIVVELAAEIGLRGIHAGLIDNSAAAEALTSLLIAINMRYKTPGAGIRITGIQDKLAR